jgi:hypothetical protein
MGVTADLLTWNFWAGLALGFAIGLAGAWLFALLNRAQAQQNDERAMDERRTMEERKQFLLFCGDGKAVADLAIQRNMMNEEFLRRLKTLPCHAVLAPHLSEEFAALSNGHIHDDRGPTLAVAFRRDVERLEREWSPRIM